MALCYLMAAGLNKGHKVTEKVSKPRHSYRRECLTKHTKFMQDMIQEVCSFAPLLVVGHGAFQALKTSTP